MSKLKQETAQIIINRYISGETSHNLANEYGIGAQSITNIVSGKTFKNCIRPDKTSSIIKQRQRHSVINSAMAQEIIDKYIAGESSVNLADNYGVVCATIINIVTGKVFKDCVRPNNIKEITKSRRQHSSIDEDIAQQIINEYVKGEKSANLANKYNITSSNVNSIISGKSFNECQRPNNIKEITKRRTKNGTAVLIDHLEPTQKQKDIIIGSLLGDGSIKADSGRAFSKTQYIKSKEYIDWHLNELKPFSSKIYEVYSDKKFTSRNRKTNISVWTKMAKYLAAYKVQTYTHAYFSELRKLWYPHGIKIIPKNIKLSPLSIAIWFCDDGWNLVKNRRAGFCTHSFTIDDVNFIRNELLINFNIKSSLVLCEGEKKQPTIGIYGKSYDTLIALISPYIIWDCFKYKIKKQNALKRYQVNGKLKEGDIITIFEMYNSGISPVKIYKKFNISKHALYSLLNGKTYKDFQHHNKILFNPVRKVKTPVRCINTGQEFNSYAQAAKYIGTDHATLSKSIKNGWKCCGYNWEKI